MPHGQFITLEGIEGSGKSLQLGRLQRYLEAADVRHLVTLEPGGTALGRELRSVLLRTEGAPREPVAELLLYLADRYQHLKEVIEPALNKGVHVLSDRYHDATLAYQGYARGIGLDWIDQLACYLGIRRPDVTMVLDVPVEIGLRRARAREVDGNSELGRFEAEDYEFHLKVRDGYAELARREPERVFLVNGEGPPEQVFERLLALLGERLSIQ